MAKIQVLIVDDHPMLRRGLRSLLSCYEDIKLVGEAGDGAAALELARQARPDVVLLDIGLPGPDGVEVAHLLEQQVPEAKIIVLTAYENEEYIKSMLGIGVYAYLLKNTSDEMLVDTIRKVHQGRRLLTPSLWDKVLQQFSTLAKADTKHTYDLEEEELTVLSLIAQGADIREISESLFSSERTVKRKIEAVIAKLGAKNRTQAVAQAIKIGLI